MVPDGILETASVLWLQCHSRWVCVFEKGVEVANGTEPRALSEVLFYTNAKAAEMQRTVPVKPFTAETGVCFTKSDTFPQLAACALFSEEDPSTRHRRFTVAVKTRRETGAKLHPR